jgi:hypothetical protein
MMPPSIALVLGFVIMSPLRIVADVSAAMKIFRCGVKRNQRCAFLHGKGYPAL